MTRCGEVILRGSLVTDSVDSMLKEDRASQSRASRLMQSHTLSSPLCPPGFGSRIVPVTVEPAEFGFAFVWRKQKQAAVDRE